MPENVNEEAPYVPPSDLATDVSDGDVYSLSGPRRYTALMIASWLAILGVVSLIAAFVYYNQFFGPRSMEMSGAELIGINLTAKSMIGLRQPAETALDNVGQFKTGPLEQRYGHAILVNEFAGADKALEQLAAIDEAVAEKVAELEMEDEPVDFPTESQAGIRRVLGQLFEQYQQGDFDSSSLPPEDRELLTRRLGWVGKLALTPSKSPRKGDRRQINEEGSRTFVILAIATVLGILVILAAFVAIAIMVGLVVAQIVSPHFQNQSRHGFVYLETFAIWIVFFFGLQIVTSVVGSLIQQGSVAMALGPVAFFGSLLALAWPVVRGISFRTMCRDIGWELKNPFVEILVGGFSYLALIVPMLFGISISILLGVGMSWINAPAEFESAGPVGHPIAEEIASGGTLVWILVVVSACVAAPIVEETMFRGVLYRFLRDATDRRQRWVSVVLSSLISGLIFASIHPQGIVGIPVLTTLAFGFSLVREWRSSLIAPIVMHAINNGLVTGLLLLLMS